MASIAFPSLSKQIVLSDGTTYGYVLVNSSTATKPTFLLLHGYPSSSFDWRKQIETLSANGFGVIVPDLLGYGDTDAPEKIEAYRMGAMSQHMSEILDFENVSRCIAVGHDWGSGLLSRLVTYFPERLLGAVFVSVGYLEPGWVWDIHKLNKLSREAFGYETFGYWLWHNTDEAVKDCQDHPASVFNLLYPTDPDDWKRHFAPVGKAAEYVRTGQTGPLPSWYAAEDYEIRGRILNNKGYRGPLNWYKAAVRGINLPDEALVTKPQRVCDVPTLLVVSDQDYVTRADAQSENTKRWTRDLRIETLDCGHWIQLERPNELQRLFEEFAAELAASYSNTFS